MKNNRKVPELRFEEFADAWEQRKLGDMGSTFTGLSGKTKEDFGHGNAKFITYMNVFSNPIADLQMTETVEIDSKQNCVKGGDVFFTTSSETPEEVGMSCVMPEDADNTYLNSFCFGYRPTEKFDLNYLAYVLRSESFRKEMTFLAQGISRYNISKNKVMEVEIPVPILNEQSKLGQFFSTLDHLITLHQDKYEKLLDFKKSMMYKLFPKEGETTPELRFDGFNGEWKKVKLGTVLKQRIEPQKISDEAPLLSFSYAEGVINPEDKKSNKRDFIMLDKYNKIFSRTEKNDIIYNPANVIHGAIHRNKLGTGVVSPIYKIFICQDVNAKYIGERVRTPDFIKEIKKYIEGSVTKLRTLSADQFLDMIIEIPSSPVEQEKIGDYFVNLDKIIDFQEQKIKKLKNIKSSLLDKMFV